jgi:hypothetical protein
MRACVHHLTAVSVDLISMSMARDINQGLAAKFWVIDTYRLEGDYVDLDWGGVVV